MSAAIRWLLSGISFQTKDERVRLASIPFKTGNDADYRAAIALLDREESYERKYGELIETTGARIAQDEAQKKVKP